MEMLRSIFRSFAARQEFSNTPFCMRKPAQPGPHIEARNRQFAGCTTPVFQNKVLPMASGWLVPLEGQQLDSAAPLAINGTHIVDVGRASSAPAS
jgi:hypothetical protein